MDKEDNILLSKWLEGKISPSELAQLEKEVDLGQLQAVLEQQKAFELEVVDADSMWSSFNQQLEQQTIPVQNQEQEAKTIAIGRRGWLSIAASLLFLIVAGYFAFQFINQDIQIQTAFKEVKTHQLASGSEVKLSPASFIKYDDTNWETRRSIQLKGQAYFKVSKGAPFSVNTNAGTVDVLGTEFDVWVAENYMRVQCFEGKVQVTHPKTGDLAYLKPGEEVRLNKEQLFAVEKIDSTQSDWLQQDKLVYKRIPARIVLDDIRRFLDIEVETSGVNTNDEFTGLIPLKDPMETARYFAESMGWKYSLTSESILFSN